MTESQITPLRMTLVAIDIAKDRHDVLIEAPAPARRQRFRMANSVEDFQRLADYLRGTGTQALIVNEPLTAGRLSQAQASDPLKTCCKRRKDQIPMQSAR